MRRLVLTFLFLLCSLPALAQSTGPIAPSGTPNPITDASAIAGNAATKWNPAYWGNPGHGIVHRFNRILCGEAALASSDAPVSVPDWMETLFPGLVQNSQFICIDTIGSLSVVGAARTSDYRTAFGGVSQGSQGVTGIGVNDDTGAGAPIACGSCPFGIRNTGVGGVTLGSQMDVNNGGSLVDLEPSGGIVGGSTIAGLFTGGAYSTFATQKASADIVLEQGSSIPTRKGIVAMAHAFDTALGAGGSGLFAEIYRGQSIRWRNATPTTDSEIWADASGL